METERFLSLVNRRLPILRLPSVVKALFALWMVLRFAIDLDRRSATKLFLKFLNRQKRHHEPMNEEEMSAYSPGRRTDLQRPGIGMIASQGDAVSTA